MTDLWLGPQYNFCQWESPGLCLGREEQDLGAAPPSASEHAAAGGAALLGPGECEQPTRRDDAKLCPRLTPPTAAEQLCRAESSRNHGVVGSLAWAQVVGLKRCSLWSPLLPDECASSPVVFPRSCSPWFLSHCPFFFF